MLLCAWTGCSDLAVAFLNSARVAEEHCFDNPQQSCDTAHDENDEVDGQRIGVNERSRGRLRNRIFSSGGCVITGSLKLAHSVELCVIANPFSDTSHPYIDLILIFSHPHLDS